MTPKEIVLGGYQSFSVGDLESLGKIFHENAVIRVNGNHKRSGEYKGFDDWRDNFVSHLPNDYPNFDLENFYFSKLTSSQLIKAFKFNNILKSIIAPLRFFLS